MSRALPLLLLGLLTACGPAAPYPAVPTPAPASSNDAAPPSTAAADDDELPPGPPLEPFELAWARQTRPFTRGLALSAEYVAVLSSQHLALISLRSGKLLAERTACAGFGQAFAFVGAELGAMLCDDGVHLLSLPLLEARATRPLAASPRLASFAAGRAALAFADGSLRIYATDSWQQERRIEVAGEISALDLSPDGASLAIGLNSGDVLVQRLDQDAPTRLTARPGLSVEALAWAQGGVTLFVAAGPLAATFGVDGTLRKRISLLAGVRAARWLGPRQLGTAGREGLLVADSISGAVGGIGGGLTGGLRPVALAASSASSALCSASLDGLVACFSRGDLPASPQLPLQVGLPQGQVEIAAQVTHHDGDVLSVAPLAGMPFAPEDGELSLLRFSQSPLRGVRTARWIEAARCRVVDVGADELELRIESRPEGLGVPLDPFFKDDPVKLRWRAAASP